MSYVSFADLGGKPDSRPVRPESDEPCFHAEWEARAFALTLAMGAAGCWNLDMSRAARETLPDYPALSYYQVWFEALQRLLLERQLVQRDEIDAGHTLHPTAPLPSRLAADQVATTLAAGTPTLRPATSTPRFALGDAVRTSAVRPPHHTRLPGYALGRRGRIEHIHGMHVFADSHAQGLGEQPQWLYSVVFDATELFGPQSDPGLQVAIDAWESYLSPLDRAR